MRVCSIRIVYLTHSRTQIFHGFYETLFEICSIILKRRCHFSMVKQVLLYCYCQDLMWQHGISINKKN